MYRHEKLRRIIEDMDLDDTTKTMAARDIFAMLIAGKLEEGDYNDEDPVDLLGTLFVWEDSALGFGFWLTIYHRLCVCELQEG